jgi:hypothetical protein
VASGKYSVVIQNSKLKIQNFEITTYRLSFTAFRFAKDFLKMRLFRHLNSLSRVTISV